MMSLWVYDPEPRTPTQGQRRPMGKAVQDRLEDTAQAVGDIVAPIPVGGRTGV